MIKRIEVLVLTLILCSLGFACNVRGERYYPYTVMAVYPHDPTAFVQGLLYHDGFLYESTGLYGASSLRKVSLEDGQIVRSYQLPSNYFGEGIAIIDQNIIQLTWREQVGFVYDIHSFDLISQFYYSTEGWGLTFDGEHLIMSDGSDQLTFLDPSTYESVRQITVKDSNGSVKWINELEYINGIIYANIWYCNEVVLIDPATGSVLGWIDFSDLLNQLEVDLSQIDVLNGIAYDENKDLLYVTGKLWPSIFAIKVGY